MIVLLHGENIVLSRKLLTELLEKARDGVVVQINGQSLTPEALRQALSAQDLFSQKRTVYIENLLSSRKSKQKDEMVDEVAKSPQDIVLWESKTVSVTTLKKFPHARVQHFKTSPSVFAWLDSIRPSNFGQSVELLSKAEAQDSIEMCFAMLCQQVRLLLQLKLDAQAVKLAPFSLMKLKKQAEKFTVEQLLAIHKKLVDIDLAQKTSSSALSLRGQLDLLMHSL